MNIFNNRTNNLFQANPIIANNKERNKAIQRIESLTAV